MRSACVPSEPLHPYYQHYYYDAITHLIRLQAGVVRGGSRAGHLTRRTVTHSGPFGNAGASYWLCDAHVAVVDKYHADLDAAAAVLDGQAVTDRWCHDVLAPNMPSRFVPDHRWLEV